MNLRNLWNHWLRIRRFLDRLALPLGLAGLVAVVAYNWRQWQQDKKRLAHLQQAPPLPPLEEWPQLPLVSVLVAAWNEAQFIERHIESFMALRYPKKELVICAGGSDGTFALAKQYEGAHVKILEQQPGEGKQKSLARSFPLTLGDIIFLTDADCFLDDEAFEHTLYPVACGNEQVTTGGSRPHPELLENPLVLAQAASDLSMYSNYDAPDYLPGLLGRNAAITRVLLARTNGFEVPAPTGTDYVLAKILVAAGVHIRQLRHSQVATAYPTTASDYVNQQRRWLRNVALYGTRFGNPAEVGRSLLLSISGLTMILLPIMSLVLGKLLLVLWYLVLAYGFCSRVRQLHFMKAVVPLPFSWRQYGYLLFSLLLDFIAWILPLFDYPSRRRQTSW